MMDDATQEPIAAADLAAQLAARMCHDFISPASAIASGLDLLDDPTAAEMREDAMGLIAGSARKLVALLAFSRVAFGASASAESFDPRELERLARGLYEHVRPDLAWAVELEVVNKAAARALLNLAQIAAGALPTGGEAQLSATLEGGEVVVRVQARSPRARLRPEVVSGLRGERLESGLGGQWVQAYYLHALVTAAGGRLDHTAQDGLVEIWSHTPA